MRGCRRGDERTLWEEWVKLLCPRCCQFTKWSSCLARWPEVGPHRLGSPRALFSSILPPHSLPAPASPAPCSMDVEAVCHCYKKEHSSFRLSLSVQFSRNSRREEEMENKCNGSRFLIPLQEILSVETSSNGEQTDFAQAN